MATVYKRGRVWYSKIKIHGKRVRVPLSTNRSIADEKLGQMVKERNASKHGHAPEDLSIDTFRRIYLAHRRARRIKPKTLEADDYALRLLSETTLRKLSQVTPKSLNATKTEWIQDRLWKRGPKKGQPVTYSINRDLRHIKMAMNWAHQEGYAPKHDWRPVKQIKTPKGRMEFWTMEQMQQIKNKMDGFYLIMTYLGFRAGLRPAEMYWLEWSDVDFDADKVHVSVKPHWIPKDYECRSIPMPPDLRQFLKGLRRNGPRVLGEGLPSLPYTGFYFRKRVRNRSGLRGSLYKLRHTYASHYVQNGGDLYRLKEYMGHSSIETTQIYAHLAPVVRDKTLDKMPILA